MSSVAEKCILPYNMDTKKHVFSMMAYQSNYLSRKLCHYFLELSGDIDSESIIDIII